MRRIISLLIICLWAGINAAPLPVSAENQREADLYVEFLQANLQEKDIEEMCQFYHRLLEKMPGNKYLYRQLLMCALEQKNMQEAEQYADFINQGENDGEDLSVYAFYLWRKGDIVGAQQYYEQALDAAPDDMRILYQYLLLLSVIDVDKAAQTLQERKAQYPAQSAKLDYETGNLYRNRRLWKQALHYYQLAKKEAPEMVEPYLASAEIYEKTGQLFLMLHELESAEQLGYQDAAIYVHLGSVYVLVKDHARAKESFLKAKELDAGDVNAGHFLSVYAQQEGKFAEAARYLQETADYSSSAEKQVRVSFLQQQARDTAGALETLQQAYKQFPENIEVAYFYGLLLQDTGQHRTSARVLKKLLDNHVSYANARLAYAFALESLGKYKEMERQVRQLLEQNPHQAAAYNLLGFSLAERNIRLNEARELITKALEISPQDAAFIDSLAWVYYRQGELDLALQLFEKMPSDFIEQNAEVCYHLGAVYAAKGEVQKALPYLQQAAAENKHAAKLFKKLQKDIQ